MRSSTAALPRHFLKIVNFVLGSNDKTGKRLVGPIATTTFWGNQPDFGGFQFWSDSVVIYDRRSLGDQPPGRIRSHDHAGIR